MNIPVMSFPDPSILQPLAPNKRIKEFGSEYSMKALMKKTMKLGIQNATWAELLIHEELKLETLVFESVTVANLPWPIYLYLINLPRLIYLYLKKKRSSFAPTQHTVRLKSICSREQLGLFSNFHEWLPQPRVEIRKSLICSQVQLIIIVLRKKKIDFPLTIRQP